MARRRLTLELRARPDDDAASKPFGRYFQRAARPFAREFIAPRPAQLVGDEVADHGCAIPAPIGGKHRWPADLPPIQHQLVTRSPVRRLMPANQDLASAIGK